MIAHDAEHAHVVDDRGWRLRAVTGVMPSRVARMGPGADDELVDVAEMFGEVARQLLGEHRMPETLQRIVQLAVEHLDACEFAGISFVEGKRITSPASSNDLPRVVDAI